MPPQGGGLTHHPRLGLTDEKRVLDAEAIRRTFDTPGTRVIALAHCDTPQVLSSLRIAAAAHVVVPHESKGHIGHILWAVVLSPAILECHLVPKPSRRCSELPLGRRASPRESQPGSDSQTLTIIAL
jgi:hypothetical protein